MTDKRGAATRSSSVYRRRECLACGARWATYEIVMAHDELAGVVAYLADARAKKKANIHPTLGVRLVAHA